MFHNYFFLKRLADALNSRLSGMELTECFSQNKDELVLGFSNKGNSQYLRANLDPNISLLQFPSHFARAGRNSVDLFQDLIGNTVDEVAPFKFDRSFFVRMGAYQLIFKMHGRRSNIILIENDIANSIFRHSLPNDLQLTPSGLRQDISITKNTFAKNDHDPTQLIPALGKEVKAFLQNEGFYQLDQDNRWHHFQQLLVDLEKNPISLLSGPRISLLQAGEQTTTDPIEASNWLYDQTVRFFYFDREKQEIANKLKQRIKKSESYIHKTSEKLRKVEKGRNPEELANLLMANLHQLHQGMKEAHLHDLYTDEPITIKLSETLSPQKNAEKLYRKGKNRHQEITTLKENIAAKEKLMEKLSRQILHLDEIKDIKALRSYAKELGLKENKKKSDIGETLPYHRYELDGWEIFLGKHAKANDELTLKVANKNDLWLHAKDVAGSHVVIRQQAGQNFPKHIIERAAALAAANSKRKTDSLCPVIFTLKKFVRKAKGSPAGQVIVAKEDVLMVEPMNLS